MSLEGPRNRVAIIEFGRFDSGINTTLGLLNFNSLNIRSKSGSSGTLANIKITIVANRAYTTTNWHLDRYYTNRRLQLIQLVIRWQ